MPKGDSEYDNPPETPGEFSPGAMSDEGAKVAQTIRRMVTEAANAQARPPALPARRGVPECSSSLH